MRVEMLANGDDPTERGSPEAMGSRGPTTEILTRNFSFLATYHLTWAPGPHCRRLRWRTIAGLFRGRCARHPSHRCPLLAWTEGDVSPALHPRCQAGPLSVARQTWRGRSEPTAMVCWRGRSYFAEVAAPAVCCLTVLIVFEFPGGTVCGPHVEAGPRVGAPASALGFRVRGPAAVCAGRRATCCGAA